MKGRQTQDKGERVRQLQEKVTEKMKTRKIAKTARKKRKK